MLVSKHSYCCGQNSYMCTQIINTQMLKEHGRYEYISGLLAPWLYTLLSLLILIFLCSFPRFLFFLNSKLCCRCCCWIAFGGPRGLWMQRTVKCLFLTDLEWMWHFSSLRCSFQSVRSYIYDDSTPKWVPSFCYFCSSRVCTSHLADNYALPCDIII